MLFYFSFNDFYATAGDTSAAEVDPCSTTVTALTQGNPSTRYSRWNMHSLIFLLMQFFMRNTCIDPYCSLPLIPSLRS